MKVANTCSKCGAWAETTAVTFTGESGAYWLCDMCLATLRKRTQILWIVALIAIPLVVTFEFLR